MSGSHVRHPGLVLANSGCACQLAVDAAQTHCCQLKASWQCDAQSDACFYTFDAPSDACLCACHIGLLLAWQTQVEDPSKYGVVVMDEASCHVERFVEKPKVGCTSPLPPRPWY